MHKEKPLLLCGVIKHLSERFPCSAEIFYVEISIIAECHLGIVEFVIFEVDDGEPNDDPDGCECARKPPFHLVS